MMTIRSLSFSSVKILLRSSVASVSILISFLASVFIFGAPACLFAGVGFAIFGVLKPQQRETYLLAVAGILIPGIFILVGALLPTSLPFSEISKGAFGAALFFMTLVLAPDAVLYQSSRGNRAILFLSAIVIVAFLAEFFGIFSLKSVGIVSWFKAGSYRTQVDLRPSGLFSEPSWHALAASGLAYYLAKSNLKLHKFVAVLLCITSILSGSSSGLALAGPIFYRLAGGGERGLKPKIALAAMILFGLIIIIWLPAYGNLQMGAQFEKILDPTAYGSGRSRFSAPMRYIDYVFNHSPLFGMGLSYITEKLIGRTGAAVLFFNVFIQMGFVGLFVYIAFIGNVARKYKSNAVDIFSAFMLLCLLGLEGSPFQAILLVLFLVPFKRQGPRAELKKGMRVSGAAFGPTRAQTHKSG